MRNMIFFTVLLLVLAGGSVDSTPVYSHTVLGLYNSEQNQTAKENEINFYLVSVLKRMGLEVRFHDIAEGIPEVSDEYRAVISWFRGGTMKDPEAYLRYMNDVIQSGKKYVVLGNLGAFGNSKTGTYLPKETINTALSRLGLRYQYEWTNDPNLLTLETIDRKMVEHQGKQNVDISRFYYRFVPADRELKVYLALDRKDKEYDPSPVIVTNRNGGFALGSYIYHYREKTVTMLLNLEAFFSEALFPSAKFEKVGLLVDNTTEANRRILANTEVILERAKIRYDVITRDQLSGLLPQDLYAFTMVGLILSDDAGLTSSLFGPFLEKRGGIVSLSSGNFSALSPLLGLSENRIKQKNGKGYRFPPDFLLGNNLTILDDTVSWSPGPLLPGPDIRIISTDAAGSVPLLWSLRRGKGNIYVWNWKGFETKLFRGLLLETFLALRPVGVGGTPGIGVMFLDDWPLPMYNVVKKPLPITDTTFYTEVWWPEMKDFFARYDMPFSTYLIFEYNSTNEPPYVIEEFFIARGQPSTVIAREIIESRNELAFHGYNHRSLLLDDSNPAVGYWPDKNTMKQGLATAKEEWIRLFGEQTLPSTYVAPNNAISRAGIEAVAEIFPSIHVIGTVISGQYAETTSEFTISPEIPTLYYLPRLSSGYILDSPLKTGIVSAVMGYGIWTHFIHADDIYDPYRSRGLDWSELREGLREAVEFVRHHYPWLDYMTANKAGYLLREYEGSSMEYSWNTTRNEATIIAPPGFRYRIRINHDETLSRAEGAKIIYRYENGRDIILEQTQGKSVLRF